MSCEGLAASAAGVRRSLAPRGSSRSSSTSCTHSAPRSTSSRGAVPKNPFYRRPHVTTPKPACVTQPHDRAVPHEREGHASIVRGGSTREHLDRGIARHHTVWRCSRSRSISPRSSQCPSGPTRTRSRSRCNPPRRHHRHRHPFSPSPRRRSRPAPIRRPIRRPSRTRSPSPHPSRIRRRHRIRSHLHRSRLHQCRRLPRR